MPTQDGVWGCSEGVGKSCLALRFTRGVFDAGSRATVGAAFSAATVTLPSGASCKFELWDTAGQERYQSLAPLYYRGSHAAAIVYDVTKRDTLAKAQFWLEELRRYAGQGIVLTLVGNKTDLAELRQVSEEEGRNLADGCAMGRLLRGIGAMFVEASAATGANVGEVFEGVAAKLAGGLPVSVNAAATAIF
ncbi:Ras-related protein RABF1 [Tetrabaena socialis]|uniref:Ras-related protein RABF1 n=1 Tax=Tetrabaena socialis TaxID=47790 RepID=A0A2J7ZTT5_9CHLO|nr:Ras-related protein RABF1 [Tetrabaena socialis]|eukprot:PNH03650.1 Ras-related protein RABF1 [Tetrabaena socialis]